MQTADWQIIYRVTYTNIYYICLYLYLYLNTYTYIPIPIPIYLYLYEALVWLTEVLFWLTQVRVCKSAVCFCRTPKNKFAFNLATTISRALQPHDGRIRCLADRNREFFYLPTLIFCSFLDNVEIIVNKICF